MKTKNTTFLQVAALASAVLLIVVVFNMKSGNAGFELSYNSDSEASHNGLHVLTSNELGEYGPGTLKTLFTCHDTTKNFTSAFVGIDGDYNPADVTYLAKTRIPAEMNTLTSCEVINPNT